MTDAPTLYERAGGAPFFEALSRHFYEAVTGDDLLRPIYPEPDPHAPLDG